MPEFRFLRYSDEAEIPLTPRLENFARKYIARWIKRYGSAPAGAHSFPTPWEPTFLIDFGEPPVPKEPLPDIDFSAILQRKVR
jgi:hypothetical protein